MAANSWKPNREEALFFGYVHALLDPCYGFSKLIVRNFLSMEVIREDWTPLVKDLVDSKQIEELACHWIDKNGIGELINTKLARQYAASAVIDCMTGRL
jgi:hypothetical protein